MASRWRTGSVWWIKKQEKDGRREVHTVGKKKSPAEELTEFLNYIDAVVHEYQYAYDIVNEEDRRLQDLLHEMEFAEDRTERNRVAARLQKSRRLRRENKDIVQKNERLVKFFEDQKNRETLNRMRTERNRVAARLQKSRRLRRENKDIVQKNERLVKFFEDQKNRETLNRMQQLLGQQRKEEEFLKSKRIYKPRVEV